MQKAKSLIHRSQKTSAVIDGREQNWVIKECFPQTNNTRYRKIEPRMITDIIPEGSLYF